MSIEYWRDGEPCTHPGCASHVSHRCEGCGRTGAVGRAIKRDSTIYVDGLFYGIERDPVASRVGARHGHRWCHMWSDDVNALHRFATRVGLRREWFQDKPGFPHYDLIPAKRQWALRLGAVEKPLREWLREKRKLNLAKRLS